MILQLPKDILPSNGDILEYYKIIRESSSTSTINVLAKEIGKVTSSKSDQLYFGLTDPNSHQDSLNFPYESFEYLNLGLGAYLSLSGGLITLGLD